MIRAFCLPVMMVILCLSAFGQNRISVSLSRFDSTTRMSGSSWRDNEVNLIGIQGRYVAISIHDVQLDTATRHLIVKGRVDSAMTGSYSRSHVPVDSVALIIGPVRWRQGDSSVMLGRVIDSLQQVRAQSIPRPRTPRDAIHEAIKMNEGISKLPIPSMTIYPSHVFHPAPDGWFEIDAEITRDSYLLVAAHEGPAQFYMVGSLLP